MKKIGFRTVASILVLVGACAVSFGSSSTALAGSTYGSGSGSGNQQVCNKATACFDQLDSCIVPTRNGSIGSNGAYNKNEVTAYIECVDTALDLCETAKDAACD